MLYGEAGALSAEVTEARRRVFAIPAVGLCCRVSSSYTLDFGAVTAGAFIWTVFLLASLTHRTTG